MKSKLFSRRQFGVLAPLTAPAALAWQQAARPIRIGVIGTGGRGQYLLGELEKCRDYRIELTALCDIYQPHLKQAASKAAAAFGSAPRTTSNYAELLRWEDVDAVFISSPDFLHSRMLIDAIRASKDVYCEKPFAVKWDEAKRAWETVRASDRVVQIGTQRRSDPYHISAARLLSQGILHQITRVDIAVGVNEPRWAHRDPSQISPADVDWARFIPDQPNLTPNPRLLLQWQLFRATTNGIPGLWMSHFADLIPWFTGNRFPVSAVASGGIYFWKDGRQTEDMFQALVEYPSGLLFSFSMYLTSSLGNRNLWHGTRATLDLDARRILPDPQTKTAGLEREMELPAEAVNSHVANFLECVRSRQKPRADVDAGFQHAAATTLAARALETGRRVRFHPETLEME